MAKNRGGTRRNAAPSKGAEDHGAEARGPALKKPTAAEELAAMHPIERFLVRTFEFCASIKLALVLMVWLMVECAVGTFVEAHVNAQGARYFIYGSLRFSILLALLGLCVLCAALIRFPWKRYQTGFVVTHCGLLAILAGALMTVRGRIDALMSVEQGKTNNVYHDPDNERLVVNFFDRSGKRRSELVPLRPGPFTWGHKLFGVIPWREGHVFEHNLKSGDVVRVKRFFANSEIEPTYVAAESGQPALRYRLFAPERADIRQWIAGDPRSGFGQERLGIGSILLWPVKSEAELDHFVESVPTGPSKGLLGTLSYSHAGNHYRFDVAEMRQGPVQVPETDITLRLEEYLPNFRLDKVTGKLVADGEIPDNPVLRIVVVEGETESPPFFVFGSHPELSAVQQASYGTEHLLSYFPDDLPAVIHLVVAPDGRLGYRAFGSQGLIASEVAEPDREYPSWAGLTFVPLTVLPQAQPDLNIRPKRLKKGKDANEGNRAVVVEVQSGDEVFEASVARDMSTPVRGRLGDREVTISYEIAAADLPFKVRLDDFHEPKNPGTRQAAAYRSSVTLLDRNDKEIRKQDIYMNHPLYFDGGDGIEYTLFQSGIQRPRGIAISTYTVAYDPGLQTIYAGAIILCSGVFLMFYMGGYFKKRTLIGPKSPREGDSPATGDSHGIPEAAPMIHE